MLTRFGALLGVGLLTALSAMAGTACSNANAKNNGPALAKSVAATVPAVSVAPMFKGYTSPGVVTCGKETCPVQKGGRRVCCNAPPAPPMCRYAERCGQATGFKYSGMLSCNEPADCSATDPGRDVVCCLSNDGFKHESSTDPYNRASCTPRIACAGDGATTACLTDSDCTRGLHCRSIAMGTGIEIGACLP